MNIEDLGKHWSKAPGAAQRDIDTLVNWKYGKYSQYKAMTLLRENNGWDSLTEQEFLLIVEMLGFFCK